MRGTQIFKPDRMKSYLLMNCFGRDQTDLKGTGYFYDSLRECENHFKEILKNNPGLERQLEDKKPRSKGDSVYDGIKSTTIKGTHDQTSRGSDKVTFCECSGSECTNLSEDDRSQTGGSDESRNSSDETSEFSEQDREPYSQNRLSKVTGLLAKDLLPAGLDRNKDYIDMDCDTEHSEWEGHSHPNTDPPSTKSTNTNKIVDQTWKGDELAFRNPQKSQNTKFLEEDISQTEDSNAIPRKLQNKNLGSKNSDGSREYPDETSKTLGQDRVPRSRDKQWTAFELPAQHALQARSKSIHTQSIPEQLKHSVVVDGRTIILDSRNILDSYSSKLEFLQKSDHPVEVCYLQVSKHIFLDSYLNLEVFLLFLTETQVILSWPLSPKVNGPHVTQRTRVKANGTPHVDFHSIYEQVPTCGLLETKRDGV